MESWKLELSHYPQLERNFVPKFSMRLLRKLGKLYQLLVFLGCHIFDVVILEVASPVVSVIDISSDSDLDSNADSRKSVKSSTLWATGLEAYPL
ncbi:hypothetical protein Hanom_Chr02g00110721 [Helianthus anomalus]